MDDVSIISLLDSDISIHTLLDADAETTSTQLDQLTPNEKFYSCSLFVNHWVDGIIKTDEDLRSAKKYYVERLKQKPIESSTIVFEKKTSKASMLSKEKTASISSRNTGRSRSPSNSNEESRKKSSDCNTDIQKKRRDENHNKSVGITERRKTTYMNQPKTATIESRKTILIDPIIHTQKSNRHNPFAKNTHHNSSNYKNIKEYQRSLSSSSNETVKFPGNRLGTTSSNHTSTSGKLHEENKLQSKDHLQNDSKNSSCCVPKHPSSSNRPSSSHRGSSSLHRTDSSSSHRGKSSSNRAESSSHQYGPSSHRRESSLLSERSTHRSSNSRDRKSNKRRSSKDSHKSHSGKKSRLSEEDMPESKQFSKNTEPKGKLSPSKLSYSENDLKAAQRKDNITTDMLNSSIKLATGSPLKEVDLFEMEHDDSFTNPLKNYKIPKKSSSNHRISTSLNTSNARPSTTPKTHKHSIDKKPITLTLTSEASSHKTNCHQNKNSSAATTLLQKSGRSPQNVCEKNVLPDVPELDDWITPKMTPTVKLKPLKFNPVNRNVKVKKEVIVSSNELYIVRYKNNGKIKITKNEKSTEERSTIKTNDVVTTEAVTSEIDTSERATSEAVTTEFVKSEATITEIVTCDAATSEGVIVATNEIATNEISTNEVATNIFAANEDVTNEVVSKEFVKNEVASKEFVCNVVASEPIVDMAMINNASHDVDIQVDENEITRDNNISIQIDFSQQTEVFTSNFGGQKNDDEMTELLRVQGQSISIFKEAVQEYEESIKEREHEIVSQKKTIIEQQNMIEEREKIIKERDRMISERDLMIKEREQKLRDYEEKIKLKEQFTDMELANLQRMNASLVGVLREKEANCQVNHREKAKPRNTRPKPQSNFHSEMIRPPNMPVTSNLNGFQNEVPRSSPQQGLSVRNINELTGNSPPILPSLPSTSPYTYFSSPSLPSSSSTLAHLLTNSANNEYKSDKSTKMITNTFSNATTTTSISNSASNPNQATPTVINNATSNSISNADFTSIGNNGQTTRQQEPQQIRVQGPDLEWSFDLDALNVVSNSSTPTYLQATQPRIAVSQNLFPNQPTTSAATQSNSCGTSIPANVQTPHQMIPRQPQRTKSVSSRPNQMITANQTALSVNNRVIDENLNPAQLIQQRSQLRNRANTYVPGSQHNFGINVSQRWQQNNVQHSIIIQQRNSAVQSQVSSQALNQCTTFQQPINQQPVFYCLGCHKTANLVCATCRNCCTCSDFCNDVIAEKHNRDCILPNMVSISSLNI